MRVFADSPFRRGASGTSGLLTPARGLLSRALLLDHLRPPMTEGGEGPESTCSLTLLLTNTLYCTSYCSTTNRIVLVLFIVAA